MSLTIAFRRFVDDTTDVVVGRLASEPGDDARRRGARVVHRDGVFAEAVLAVLVILGAICDRDADQT